MTSPQNKSAVLKDKTFSDYWGSVAWANDQLRYAIEVLKGGGFGSLPKGRLQLALLIKRRLYEHDFWWQARIVAHWIHRFQRGDFDK